MFPKVSAAIEIELIAMLFGTVMPLVIITFGAGAIALQAAWRLDYTTAILCAIITFIAVARIAHVRTFHRAGPSALTDLSAARRWEAQYSLGSHATSAAIGIANFASLRGGDPLIAMVVLGVLAVYTFALVQRISVRPAVCAVSAALVILPTGAGLVAIVPNGTVYAAHYASISMFIIVSLLAAAAFEMLRYSYCLIVSQLTAQRDLSRMARKDALTELPNRISLRDRFEAEAASGRAMAIHYIDLDHFKAVNDLNGHQCGDALLRQVANRMTMCVRPEDVVARLGGDEFAVLQSGIASRDEAAALASRIIAAVSEPYTLAGNLRVRVGATIGIALSSGEGAELDLLLANADAALYRAKGRGRGTVEFWSETQGGRKVA